MIKPAEMTRVSVTGPKKHLREVIQRLHELELLDIEEYSGELETGEPFEEAEELSEKLVEVRSLLSKLPEDVETENGFEFDELEDLEEVRKRVDAIEERLDELESQASDIEAKEGFFKKIRGSGIEYQELRGTERLETFVGRLKNDFEENALNSRYELIEAEEADIIIYDRESGLSDTIKQFSHEEFSLVDTDKNGTPEEILSELQTERKKLEERAQQESEKLREIGVEWRGKLEAAEEFLTEKVEKSEAPIKFATTERAFVALGWVPRKQLEKMREELGDLPVSVEAEEGEEPPVKHENPGPVKPFESLTDLVAVPKYNEIDPSFVILLTFPLMFGFMIGDAGYGLTTLLVFYAGYKKFPQAAGIFKSLMYASVATIAFGLAFGDAFGYILFGHHSDLAHVTGIHFFEKIPILFHRAEHLGDVFKISAAFGLLHVNLGYLLGGYNEYTNHGLKEAFLEKGSWLVLEAGAFLWYFLGAKAGAPVVAVSVLMLYVGEGIEGVVEIPSLLSNVLSYLRMFGVSVAAVALAGVVNAMAEPLFAMHSIAGVIGGIAILMIGHTFNTFIKIMEGFLQGIRLHYVELFTKFFEGGGREYMPFGRS